MVKGAPENPTGLIQICGASKILLIQLSQIKGLPDGLSKFLEDKSIYKTGVNIQGDGLKLHRDFNVMTDGLLDLRPLADTAREVSPKIRRYEGGSLKTLTGVFLGSKMTKGKVQLSNWNAAKLTSNQIRYASKDAYASYAIYHRLMDVTKLEKSKLQPIHLSENATLSPPL
ncbi:ribonuclease H-like domain-containing protein [Chlamydoabsidia padenii]|nr:ribonuclease H-like domain-containing protein [Chlamydoabsidia padenii]